MFDNHEWIVTEGKGNPEDLTLLSLSSCGFCTGARRYLTERGLAFRYLQLDTIQTEEKTKLKEEFRKTFGRRPSFPTLIIDGERFLIGFIKKHWDEEVRPEKV